MVDDSFPFVKIPKQFEKIIGVPDEGTKLYRAYGSEEDCRKWMDTVFEICGNAACVSPGGAAAYAKVSRPGIHKKLKTGGLTGFVFHITEDSILFKGKKKLSANAFFYCYIPRSELKAWAAELDKKREKHELEYEEVMGNGDYNERYPNKPPKHLKKMLRDEQKKKK
ncbi:MAG: hypothetical protein NTW65_12340 [Deltaproteobacteria bacterium]|nr:hypothetical protein [Deltaproteobacteria bacterium]